MTESVSVDRFSTSFTKKLIPSHLKKVGGFTGPQPVFSNNIKALYPKYFPFAYSTVTDNLEV